MGSGVSAAFGGVWKGGAGGLDLSEGVKSPFEREEEAAWNSLWVGVESCLGREGEGLLDLFDGITS